MNPRHVGLVYANWFGVRLRSTIYWTLGLAALVAVTAAFYPSLEDIFSSVDEDGGLSSLLGLSEGIDPSSPLGFLWANLYANIVPWILMALGISLGGAAIAGDEERGTLEYLLSKPVERAEVLLARFGVMLTILVIAAAVSGLALLAAAPLFDLTSEMTTTGADGAMVTNPGLDVGNVAAGSFAALAVGTGTGAIAFLLGAALGRYGLAVGIASGFAIAGYIFYTLSNTTGELEFLTWISPWRWYVDDAMFINGLEWDVALPFALAAACLAVGLVAFARRDLR
ncbi:MAG: ABC transporter permease [Miltoncostaeaceae bacterium]